MHLTPIVIKVGGNDLEGPDFVAGLARAVARLEAPAVIVHGGGREISALQSQLGLAPRYVDGMRVTDPESLAVAEMVLSGRVNKRLVAALLKAGVDAIGVSGVDRGLIRVEKMDHPGGDLGRVGRVVAVRGTVLMEFLEAGVTPVISPISLGPDGAYNVNADHAAGAIALAIGASAVTFITNVPGVLVGAQVASSLTAVQAEQLIQTGVIHGGMVPKTHAALQVVAGGVPRAVITDLGGLAGGVGTAFVAA